MGFGSPLVAWLARKADAARNGREEHTLLLVPGRRPARGLRPRFLQHPGLQLLPDVSAEAAWEVAARRQPRLIIQDLDGPYPDLLELCRRFKSADSTRGLPLIVIAAAEVRDVAVEAGAEAVLDRPIVQCDYFDAVRRYVPLPRRRHTRYPANLRFSYEVDGRLRQVFSRDISLYGAFLKTDAVLPEGTHIEIGFRLPGAGGEVRCGARVRRSLPYRPQSQQLAGMAIEFEGVEESDLRRLESFIGRQQPPSLFRR
jgi:CheY-like chemotaxis protein